MKQCEKSFNGLRFSCLLVVVLFGFISILGTGGAGERWGDNSSKVAPNSISDSIKSIIGSSGGNLTTPSGNVTLNIPAGALSNNKSIKVALSDEQIAPGNLASVYSFSPDGQTFNVPATIRIKYDPDLIPEAVNQGDLVLAYMSDSGDWEIISDSEVDTTNHVVSGQTNHFSDYTVVSEKLSHGKFVGDFNGVTAYSNGACNYNATHTPTYIETGIEWECVEYVNRYYLEYYGIDIRGEWKGHAKDYYKTAEQRGLESYINGGSEPPRAGDIIVSEYGYYGHVAIVRQVEVDKIYVIQQNWCQNEGDNKFRLKRNGNYISSFGGGNYSVKGWARLPQNETYSISGTVHVGSNYGPLLTGAVVSLLGLVDTTDDTGAFSITSISAGTYPFSIAKSGYNTYYNNSYYIGSNQTNLVFYLTELVNGGDDSGGAGDGGGGGGGGGWGDCTDADNDGYYAQSGCGTEVDCNDNNDTVHPDAVEIYDDGIDNDCDGIIDKEGSANLLIDGGTSSSKDQGETFYFTGSNYTPNGTVYRYLTNPDDSQQQLSDVTADNNGNVSWSYQSSCDDMTGTYSIWARDVSTGQDSNSVNEVITSSESCFSQTETLLINGEISSTVTKGSHSTLTGANCTPNGKVIIYITEPYSGESVWLEKEVNADGNFIQDVLIDCSDFTGTYSFRIKDNSTGQFSDFVILNVSNPNCRQLYLILTSPYSQPQGSMFNFNIINVRNEKTLIITRRNDSSWHVTYTVSSETPWSFPTDCATVPDIYGIQILDSGYDYTLTVFEVTSNNSCQ